MKLAEALIDRADLQKKIAQTRSRILQNATTQEGEEPVEDVAKLIPLYDNLVAQLANLIKRINRTNGTAALGDGTLTDAIAERDCLRSKIVAYRELYSAATIKQDRYSKTEIKTVRCINPLEVQKNIDAMSKQYRVLDTSIQAANWQVDLAD